ncbi:MAG TPA: hypothetical protein VHU42_13770 [Rhodopila sp.]|jgi:hypothetical protein|nr:hypothetical protein [Rhodopila sp.]
MEEHPFLDAEMWLEARMTMSRREMRGGRVYAIPLFGIIVLLACYWLLADWQRVPAMINTALAAIHWPV